MTTTMTPLGIVETIIACDEVLRFNPIYYSNGSERLEIRLTDVNRSFKGDTDTQFWFNPITGVVHVHMGMGYKSRHFQRAIDEFSAYLKLHGIELVNTRG